MVPGSASSGVLSGIGSSSLLNAVGFETGGACVEDLLRCFAMVYERKGIYIWYMYVNIHISAHYRFSKL